MLAVLASASRDARGQPAVGVETSPDRALEEADASADYAVELERLRELNARTERLEAEIARKEAQIAALEQEARNRYAQRVADKPSFWEGLVMLVISVALALVASRAWRTGRS